MFVGRRSDPESIAILKMMTRQQQQSVAANKTKKSTKQGKRYRGVTLLRLTGKYGAHIWDPKRKASIWIGRSFKTDVEAAKAFDSAAVRLHGSKAILNFPQHHEAGTKSRSKGSRIFKSSCKKRKIEEKMSSSEGKHYRGVSQQSTGKYAAKIRAPRSKAIIFLGPFNTDIEAAKAFDSAAVTLRGSRAVLNFPKHEAGNSNSKGSELLGSSRKKRKIEEKGSSVEKHYKGVYRRRSGKYRAAICNKGASLWLGTFNTDIEAAKAYDCAAIRLHGIRAALNFPLEAGTSCLKESKASGSSCKDKKIEEMEKNVDSPIDDVEEVEVESSCAEKKIEEMVKSMESPIGEVEEVEIECSCQEREIEEMVNTVDSPMDEVEEVEMEMESSCAEGKVAEMGNRVESSIDDVDKVMKNSFPENDAEAVMENPQEKGNKSSNVVDQAFVVGHLSREQALELYLQVLRWDMQDSWLCKEGRVLF